ncbi:MAG: UDP-N-acetylmuramoylalanine--D-glutamate ligase [candidate division Zixibacteria bacterium RBG_16_53_22]|nr:MAG: UDP-N-acetylmuramoylalanine--D-glutamate ligase [candidate division Zixibacteria bacterium RBG_16_53_22]
MAPDLKGKRVSIIGAGKSGVSTAVVVMSLGGVPFVSDSAQINDATLAQRLQTLGIALETGGHTERVYDCQIMVVSPGVAADAEVVVGAKGKGIPVWPEIELAFQLCGGRVIGITGSNGKTTTTALVGEILKNAGFATFVCGNIGFPFIDIAQKVPPDGFAVVELSSFQIEQIVEFRPDIAAFLNVTPDHLDRHKDLETYTAAKMRIFENQTSGDVAVVNYDDLTLRKKSVAINARRRWFSVGNRLEDGIWAVPDGEVFVDGSELMKAAEIKIKGEHNLSNACAAIGAALAAGASKEIIVQTLKSFAGVEHRLEPVRLIGGVSFINDSKGTNVDSVFWALKAVPAPVILIAGGKDKGGDFSVLNEFISQKAKLVVLIGQATPKIEQTWKDLTRCVRAGSMEDAVRTAYSNAADGDTVLLSPGCASFDMFDNYEHRGRVFKSAVMELEEKGVTR